MTEYFDKVRSAPSAYVDSNDGALTDVRIVIYRHGEDPQRVIQAFYEEHRGHCNFAVIPLASYGNPPRKELCTQKSLSAALAVEDIGPNSVEGQIWRACAEALNVAWPKRLQAA
jgi:hypothetical protein